MRAQLWRAESVTELKLISSALSFSRCIFCSRSGAEGHVMALLKEVSSGRRPSVRMCSKQKKAEVHCLPLRQLSMTTLIWL